jgi:hypothetical protein
MQVLKSMPMPGSGYKMHLLSKIKCDKKDLIDIEQGKETGRHWHG